MRLRQMRNDNAHIRSYAQIYADMRRCATIRIGKFWRIMHIFGHMRKYMQICADAQQFASMRIGKFWHFGHPLYFTPYLIHI